MSHVASETSRSPEGLIGRRRRLMGPNVPTFYADPLHIVRGEDVWLWDSADRRYLDAYNNVPQVGHCHPKVVEAVARQSAVLNTHTRYLHEGVLDYLEMLTGTFATDISQGIMVCSASEANDIGLRMAQAVTGKTGIIATDATYHGNTTATSVLSTRRPPIGGYPPHVRLVPAPANLDPDADGDGRADAFRDQVEQAIASLEASGIGFSCLIVCPFFANEGFPDVARGFLDPTLDAVRRAGGLVIADEVQPGFGRLGDAFWGHDHLGFAPDIVSIGKSVANGYPAAAVLTRPDIMAAFREAFGYFSTYGGSPVAAAAAMATLQVIVEEGLQENARRVGAYALQRLAGIEHPSIRQARGSGLFFGLEFRGGDTLGGPQRAEWIVERMREDGILLNRIGPRMDILKIRPPLTFSEDHVDLVCESLCAALRDLDRLA